MTFFFVTITNDHFKKKLNLKDHSKIKVKPKNCMCNFAKKKKNQKESASFMGKQS